jgi:hypothetical protein
MPDAFWGVRSETPSQLVRVVPTLRVANHYLLPTTYDYYVLLATVYTLFTVYYSLLFLLLLLASC